MRNPIKISLIVLFILTHFTAVAQDSTCLDNYLWVKKTFEENYAGFDYVLSLKGKESYQKHKQVFLKKIKAINKPLECTQALYQWLTFFRKGHIAIRTINPQQNTKSQTTEPSKQELQAKYKDWQTLKTNEKAFKKHLTKTKKLSPYEGIWSSPPYTIGIKKVNNQLLGFILEAKNNYWSQGQIKLKMNENASHATFYMRDHSAVETDTIELLEDKYLTIGNVSLKRVFPLIDDDKSMERYLKLMQSNQAVFQKLSNKTVLLRIPSFAFANKKQIDIVIKDNKKIITSSKNLIIDIRNNGGGSDSSYAEILPLIYTNPIRTVGVEFLSSKLNNQRMLGFINNPDWSKKDKKWAKKSYKKLNQHLGEFVDLNETIVSTKTLNKVYKYPENVAILINHGNASTSEQFLLAAKQSRKVKLYGTTTVGMLDVSNMNFVKSPNGDFELGYSLSKSHRIPEMAIDGKGIMPDFYLDETIAKHQWVEYVQTLLEGNKP